MIVDSKNYLFIYEMKIWIVVNMNIRLFIMWLFRFKIAQRWLNKFVVQYVESHHNHEYFCYRLFNNFAG